MKAYRLSTLKKPTNIRRSNLGQPIYVASLSKIIQEVLLLANLSHPNIVKLYKVVEIPEKDKLYLILQHAELGQLLSWSPDGCNKFTLNSVIFGKEMSMETIKRVFESLANAICFRMIISPHQEYYSPRYQARKYLRLPRWAPFDRRLRRSEAIKLSRRANRGVRRNHLLYVSRMSQQQIRLFS